jgi:hypothetical protein
MPVIERGDDHFAVVTYTGNGSTQTISGLRFQPDFVWVKERSNARNHYLWDSNRGVLKELYSNLTNAESTNTIGLSSFNSDGFTLNNGDNAWNGSGNSYVAWCWKANGAGSSNTAGTISSTVSANTTAGFSVVTYTGNGSAGATIGHGIATPSMIIVKSRGTTDSWGVYHASLGNTKGLYLETTGAAVTSSAFWNNTSPTSTVFSVSNNSINNASSTNYVAYCFAPIAGYSAFGSYQGNGSSDGVFVHLGFKPKFWMSKRTDSTSSWLIVDGARNTYNIVDDYLIPNSSAAEGSATVMDFVSNGVKFRGTTHNDSGATWIYMAFAENPFKYSLGR